MRGLDREHVHIFWEVYRLGAQSKLKTWPWKPGLITQLPYIYRILDLKLMLILS